MPTETLPRSYACSACGKEHQFHPWVFAHWEEWIVHTCQCGQAHVIQRGIAKPVKAKKGKK